MIYTRDEGFRYRAEEDIRPGARRMAWSVGMAAGRSAAQLEGTRFIP